jgi:rhodanese-related sulfurtransferase
MLMKSTLRTLEFDEALAQHDEGATFVDLRRVDSYLEVHIPGSLSLQYEFGPGLASRARDCLPLSLALILIETPDADMTNAAASLRGKGFEVLGVVDDGVNQWAATRGSPASTEIIEAQAG